MRNETGNGLSGATNSAVRPRRIHSLAFFMGFLRSPEVVGSVIPSSRFLERRIVEAADLGEASIVVELGPGTGGTTQALLECMPANSRLLAIETDPKFVRLLNDDPDPRLVAHQGSAASLPDILAEHGLGEPDVVISGIPFSTMPQEVGTGIIKAIQQSLAGGGRFVAYQFRSRVAELGREIMGEPEEVKVLRNVPPMSVYRWVKPA